MPTHLHRAHGPIDHQQMADEPGGGEEESGEIEGESKDVPVGDEPDGGRGDLGRPPAIGQQARRPPAREQQQATTPAIAAISRRPRRFTG